MGYIRYRKKLILGGIGMRIDLTDKAKEELKSGIGF